MNVAELKENNTSSNFEEWRYSINNEELYQITDSTPFEEFQQRQQLKWISLVTEREYNDIIKLLTFHTASNKRLVKKSVPILEAAITVSGLIFLNNYIKRKFL